MSKHFRWIVAAALGGLLPASLEARTIVFKEKPVKVEVRYGKATVLRFESKVSSIQNAEKFEVAPLNDQSPNYAEVSVKPRTTSSGDTVNFHLVDGTIVMLRLLSVSGPKAETLETFHLVKKKGSELEIKDEPIALPDDMEESRNENKVELMKALILGSKLRGYEVRRVDKVLDTGLSDVEGVLSQVYTSKDLNGYIFKLTHKGTDSKYKVDVRRLKIGEPNLALMSQIDKAVIEPEATGNHIAYLTMVTLPSALSRDVILPVALVKTEKGQK